MQVGTVAPTDFGWYAALAATKAWSEVNFWTPSTHFAFRANEFSPFFFKLKAPHNAVCGFGYFARYAPLPDWMAWDCFGEANGCSTLATMRDRIASIRKRMHYVQRDRVADIGCIVVVNVSFFAPEEWVRQPSDWPVRNLRPMRYDLRQGEGARVWAECLQRTALAVPETLPGIGLVRETGLRYGEPTVVRPRLGQGAFRVAVTDAYGRACSVTGEHSLPALEAAHIRPFAQDGPHTVTNGLLLRADLHRLFEQGYMTVGPDVKVLVSSRLRADYNNGHTYYPFAGREISLPNAVHERPDRGLLAWHRDSVFLG